MKSFRFYLISLVLVLFASCNEKRAPQRTDTLTSGSATLLCDDCFLPLIKEEVAVFQGLNPDASITLISSNEYDAFQKLYNDSVRLIIAARNLTQKERDMLSDRGLLPRSTKVAIDGITFIIHPSNKNDRITVSDLTNILNGETTNWNQLYPNSSLGKIKVIFDNQGSSTVRYIQDSITHGKIKSPNVFACENNKEVMEYVAKTPNAIGIVGLNWMNNPLDTAEFSFVDDVRVMAISPFLEAREDNSYLPYPAYLVLKKYPFYRDVYAIITDPPGHLPSGLMNFIGGERGQRLALKSGLVPANSPMRLIQVKE